MNDSLDRAHHNFEFVLQTSCSIGHFLSPWNRPQTLDQSFTLIWQLLIGIWLNDRNSGFHPQTQKLDRGSLSPRGVLEVYMTEGVRRSFILQTQKNTQAWNFRPKKVQCTWYQNFQPKKIQEHGTHVAEKKFEWKTQKNTWQISWPKKYRACKFSTQKNTSDPPVMYTSNTPPGHWVSHLH